MKVLLLTASTGEGHNSMARAYKEACEKQGITAEILDVFADNPALDRTFNKGCYFLIRHLPHIYDFVWKIGRKRNIKNHEKVFENTSKKIAPTLLTKINEFQPDAVISVHLNGSAVMEMLKRQGKIDKNILHAAFVFEYIICPYFELNRDVDYVITPTELCHAELLKKGIDEKKIVCCGFPTSPRFLHLPQKDEARKALGLEDKFTVLTLAGGEGLASSAKLAENVAKCNPDVQIIAVCGRNEKEKRKLDDFVQKRGAKNVTVLGYANNIPQLMAASDVAFSCGGSGSTNECFVSGLPIIYRNGLIKNEKANRDLFVAEGMADKITRISQAGKKVEFYKKHPEVLQEMRGKIKAFLKPNPAETAVKFLQSRVNARKD